MDDKEFKEFVIEKLETMDNWIRGNGSPGLNQRVHDLELDKQARDAKKSLWIAGFLAIIGTLATLVWDAVKRSLFGG